jgi:hypothetical protein
VQSTNSTCFCRCEYLDELRVTISNPPRPSPFIFSVCFSHQPLPMNTGAPPPPSRVASHPWSIPVPIFYAGEFALSFSFVWYQSHVIWWPELPDQAELVRFFATGNGSRRGLPLFRRPLSLSPPSSNLERPSQVQWPMLSRTPSADILVKEPLSSFEIPAAVLSSS